MITKTIFALLPIVFAFTMPGDKDTFTLNTANRDKIKSIALASVYGENKGGIYDIHYKDEQGVSGFGKHSHPTNVRSYTFSIFDQQKCYDYLEKSLVTKFNGSNMSVVALEKTKPLYSDTIANITIMNEVMGKPASTDKQKQQMKTNMDLMAKMSAATNNQTITFNDKFGMNLGGICGTHEIASATTASATSLFVNMAAEKQTTNNKDAGCTGRAGSPKINDIFSKTYGRVAKKANADGFAVIRMESCFGGDRNDPENKDKGVFSFKSKLNGYAIVFLYVYVYTNEGELAFKDEVMGFSKGSMKMSETSNADAFLTEAIDDAVSVTFSHMSGQK